MLPAPKPQCITLSSTKFLKIEKIILKSCALWYALGRWETEALHALVHCTSPVPGIPAGASPEAQALEWNRLSRVFPPPLPSLDPLIQPSEPHPTGGSGEPASQMKTFQPQGGVELDSSLVCLHPKSVRVFCLCEGVFWGSPPRPGCYILENNLYNF